MRRFLIISFVAFFEAHSGLAWPTGPQFPTEAEIRASLVERGALVTFRLFLQSAFGAALYNSTLPAGEAPEASEKPVGTLVVFLNDQQIEATRIGDGIFSFRVPMTSADGAPFPIGYYLVKADYRGHTRDLGMLKVLADRTSCHPSPVTEPTLTPTTLQMRKERFPVCAPTITGAESLSPPANRSAGSFRISGRGFATRHASDNHVELNGERRLILWDGCDPAGWTPSDRQRAHGEVVSSERINLCNLNLERPISLKPWTVAIAVSVGPDLSNAYPLPVPAWPIGAIAAVSLTIVLLGSGWLLVRMPVVAGQLRHSSLLFRAAAMQKITSVFAQGLTLRDRALFAAQVILQLLTLVLIVRWILEPQGPFEPMLALVSLLLSVIAYVKRERQL